MRSIVKTSLVSLVLTAMLAGGARSQTGMAAPIEPVNLRATATFGFDQTALSPRDQTAMLAEVGKMKDVTWQTVRAVGYTDNVGAVAYNQRLSARRAEVVKAYLVSKGLVAEMIRTEGRAEAAPVTTNATPSGRAKNRRTEVEFVGVRTARR